jgi:hypothetical protein
VGFFRVEGINRACWSQAQTDGMSIAKVQPSQRFCKPPDSPATHFQAWLIEGAAIPPKIARQLLPRVPHVSRFDALCFLVTAPAKYLLVALAGWDFRAHDFTAVGTATVAALTTLPGAADHPMVIRLISSASGLREKLCEVFDAATNGMLVVIAGDLAGELHGHLFPAMQPLGIVKLPVGCTAAGWPIVWRPFDGTVQ